MHQKVREVTRFRDISQPIHMRRVENAIPQFTWRVGFFDEGRIIRRDGHGSLASDGDRAGLDNQVGHPSGRVSLR